MLIKQMLADLPGPIRPLRRDTTRLSLQLSVERG
jgi:hypothetical protein